jgi:DNA invertase Pin-like site-specific DNA recombinase
MKTDIVRRYSHNPILTKAEIPYPVETVHNAAYLPMNNAFAYLRVSGKGQLEGDGFTRQLSAIRKYADTNGLRVTRVFREAGVSGTQDLENRPALQDLLVALHSNGTRLIMVERLDRLARDLMIQEAIIADMKRNQFELVSVAESV